ncbi:MAG TPA: ribosome silencing factor [Solimonas sp.]|nr:ribosome silencing factor [Solimonas sp.]
MPRNTKPVDPLLKLAIGALEDMKAQNITVLDVMKLTTVTDTMVICTGTSNRHVKSLAQNVAEEAKHAGHQPLGIEGSEQGEWVLVDLGGVVVHVMQAQARAFYQLEKLWAVAEEAEEAPVVRKKPAKPPRSTTTKAKRAAARAAGVKKKPVNAGVKKRAPVKAAAGAPKKAAAKKPAAKKAASRKSVRK